jgi:hypothetical protein
MKLIRYTITGGNTAVCARASTACTSVVSLPFPSDAMLAATFELLLRRCCWLKESPRTRVAVAVAVVVVGEAEDMLPRWWLAA